MSYKEVYAGWQANPEAFWMKAAEAIDWIKAPSKALWNDDAPLYEWFKDAQVNTCYNAVDRHVDAGNGDRVAIIYVSICAYGTGPRTTAEIKSAGSWSPRRKTRGCLSVSGVFPSTLNRGGRPNLIPASTRRLTRI